MKIPTQMKAYIVFFQNQEDETKKFILSNGYDDCFMKYLVSIKDDEDEKYDMLTNKNSKFLFYHFNDYLRQINKPTKPVRHSIVADDDTALEILQNQNWQYFIEKILEVCQSNNGGELTKLVSAKEAKIIENYVENLTICKRHYANFHNQIAGNLSKAIRNLPSDELDEIDRDLRLNLFLIDFDREHNQDEIMNAYSYFYHALGRFPGKLDLSIVPRPDVPAFIKTGEVISPNQLFENLKAPMPEVLCLFRY